MNASKNDVSLEALERAAYAGRFEEAGKLLIALLRAMSDRTANAGFMKEGGRSPVSALDEGPLLTRVAGAMLALMANPRFQLSQEGYEWLVVAAAHSGTLVELSGYRSSSHLWHLLADRKPDGGWTFSENALRKGYALASLSSTPPDVVRALGNLPLAIAVPALIGLLSTPYVLTDDAHESREIALSLAHRFDDYAPGRAVISMLSSPWMLCSYADGPGKHKVKQHLNRMLRRWMEGEGIALTAPMPAPADAARPRLGVVLEFAHQGHAMMRCYAGMIGSLRNRFELVGIAAKGAIDAGARALFDDVIEIDPSIAGHRSMVAELRTRGFDALYFPSVGMARWAICLANLRIAPLQFMTLGHPATSHSVDMDAVLVPESIRFDSAVFSERVIVLPGLAAAFELHPKALSSPPEVRVNPSAVRVAVPAKLFKLSPAFLRACKAIGERAARPVEFHFFPNEKGMVFQLARQRIEQVIPDAVVYPATPYETYLSNLDRCDIALGAFTFGNTNGAIDALLRAIPMVALDGPEVHQGSEQQVMRPVGLPEWLIASSVDDYIAAALRLIDDDDERVGISNALVGRVEQVLRDEFARTGDFAGTVEWLYRNIDQIREDGRHLWRPEDQVATA